jgi:hypothetical protein
LSAQTLRRASGMSARAAKSWLETVVVLCHNPQSWAAGRTPASISLKATISVGEKPGRGLNCLPILEKGAAVSPKKTMCRQAFRPERPREREFALSCTYWHLLALTGFSI